jgi:S-DNA-T family DNA segregation ATPase FtsK/SpoIIIE
MITIPTMFDKRLKAAVPTKSAWVEAWGFVLLGLGIFLALACYTFSPFDYTAQGLNPRGISNLAGPYGAVAAARILGRFGVIGMVWPVAIMAWGALTATGFVLVPRARRFVGFVSLAGDASGFASVILPQLGLPQPSFGFGGHVGFLLKHALMPHLGFGGTLTALSVLGVVALVLTGNITVSRTAELFEDGVYYIRRTIRKLWTRYILNRDPADLAALFTGKRASAPVDAGAEAPKKRRSSAAAAEGEAPGEAGEAPAKPMAAPGGIHLELFYDGPAHSRPEPNLFTRSQKAPDRSKDFAQISENLVKQLAEFKINGEIMAVTQGPIVTTFEFKPAPGTKVSKISALGEDLARLLKAQSLRVIAPIPGKDTVGFEIPNDERAVIGFADLIDSKEFRANKRKLPIAMGVDIFGTPAVQDLAEMPHLLVAGSTGSGKSVFMNTLVGSLIARHTASSLRFIMIDPKMVEMAAYNDLPHMACPVITDPKNDAKAVLGALVVEMDDRYKRMLAVGARNIESFNEVVRTRRKSEFINFDGKWAQMPYVVLIIDELADMMMMLGKEAETPITRLAQKARACGIHMVIATQRPSADVVTGLIKANFPTRVAFRVMSGVDSRTILDQNGAETLLGKGDMLYLASGGAHRMHGAYLSENEVQSMVKAAKAKKK